MPRKWAICPFNAQNAAFFNAPLKSAAEKSHRTSCGLIGMTFATLPAVLWTPFAIGIETP
jgi:hypothetical protein